MAAWASFGFDRSMSSAEELLLRGLIESSNSDDASAYVSANEFEEQLKKFFQMASEDTYFRILAFKQISTFDNPFKSLFDASPLLLDNSITDCFLVVWVILRKCYPSNSLPAALLEYEDELPIKVVTVA